MDLARSFNLNDPDFVRDPYPVLAQLRSHGKPLWHEEMQLWLAATHADASAVLRSKTLGRIYTPQEPNACARNRVHHHLAPVPQSTVGYCACEKIMPPTRRLYRTGSRVVMRLNLRKSAAAFPEPRPC